MSGGTASILGNATQLGFVVRDIRAAMAHWTEVMNVTPFLYMEKGNGWPAPPTLHRGVEVEVRTRVAFAFMGDVEIELIEQVNDASSPYRDFLAAGSEGLHHLGFWVPDAALACAKVEAAGYVLDYEIPVGQPQSINYYRSPRSFGPMLEIVPGIWRQSRQAVLDTCRAWTGGDPILRYESYAEFRKGARVTFEDPKGG